MIDPGPSSPCIKLCTLDRAGVCIGCYRSLDEIARWTTMSVAERRGVLEAAQRRRLAQGGSAAGSND